MPCPWAGGKMPADIVPRSVIVAGADTILDNKRVFRAMNKHTFWVPCPRVVTAEGTPAKWAEDNWWPRSVHQKKWYNTEEALIEALLKDAGPRGMCLIFRTEATMPKLLRNLLGAAQDALKINRIKVIKL